MLKLKEMSLRRPPRLSLGRKEALLGYAFISPWIMGFLAFSLGPIMAVCYLSLTQYSVLELPSWVGFQNYVRIFTRDRLFWLSLYNTAYFVFLSVPGQILLAFFLALLLNSGIKGQGVYRTLLYLPMIVPAVASSLVWVWLLNPYFGVIKHLLSLVGLPSPLWFQSEKWAKLGIVLLNLWHTGQNVVILLAGLQEVPQYLHEAAKIDGANWIQRLRHVTIPLMTPTIFFVLVLGLIQHFQVFTFAYVMTRGGPLNSTLFYVLYLYRVAFRDFEMGYASALACILFVIILLFTLLTFSTARQWVHYESE